MMGFSAQYEVLSAQIFKFNGYFSGMKIRYLLLLTFLLAHACTHRTQRIMGEMNVLLDSLQSVHAPDTRIAWWNMSVSESEGSLFLEGEVDNQSAFSAIATALHSHYPEVDNRLILLPADGGDHMINGLVNNSVAHLRSRPSHMADLVTEALLGTPVKILKQVEGWCVIQTPDKYLGWVKDAEVQGMDQAALAKHKDSHKVIYTEQYGLSYAAPDPASRPVSDLVIGCILPVEGEESGFYQFSYPDGRLAWVKKEETIHADEVFFQQITGEGLAATAVDFHGIPYLWGGVSSKAIDCSGLSSTVFFMNGILLPRDADQQSSCGREITSEFTSEGLETGDLLFFGRKAAEDLEERVTHVAIYLQDGDFIHAAGYRDRVSINSMDSTRENFIPEYPDIFVRASRIVGEEMKGFEPVAENAFYREIINRKE
jgi:hypothetical protein